MPGEKVFHKKVENSENFAVKIEVTFKMTEKIGKSVVEMGKISHIFKKRIGNPQKTKYFPKKMMENFRPDKRRKSLHFLLQGVKMWGIKKFGE